MPITSQTPVPPGHAVRVLFCIRANKGLYGYAYGPFRFDEVRKCYVFHGRTYSVEEWEQQGAELILKWYKYRPSVKVEIVKDETPEPAAEPSAPAPSLPVSGDVTAPEPVAETVVTEAPEEPVAPAEPVKRTRRNAKPEPAAAPSV